MRLFYQQGITATGIDQVIAEAGVAKATLYRHFPSKDHLAIAFLERRHQAWMEQFRSALATRPHRDLPAIADVLAAWFLQPGFRGCAFINAITETSCSAATHLAVAHKAEVQTEIARLLPPHASPELAAQALIVIEGMIVRYQMTGDKKVIENGRSLLRAIVG